MPDRWKRALAFLERPLLAGLFGPDEATTHGWTPLPDHPPRSRHRGGTVLAGFFLFVAGVVVCFPDAVARALDVPAIAEFIHAVIAEFKEVTWVGVLFLFAGGGVLLAPGLRRFRRIPPDGRWRVDYPWDPEIVWDDTRAQIRRKMENDSLITVVLFLVSFAVVVACMGAPLGIRLMAVVPCVGLLGYQALRISPLIAQRMTYGRTYLRFDRFPFFLGESLDARLGGGKGTVLFQSLTFTLRCVQERYERHDQKSVMACYEMYADRFEVPGSGVFGTGAPDCPVSFVLPAQADMATQLAERPPRYWEIEAHAQTSGRDFHATYLVPVYADPGRLLDGPVEEPAAEPPTLDEQPDSAPVIMLRRLRENFSTWEIIARFVLAIGMLVGLFFFFKFGVDLVLFFKWIGEM